MQQTTFCFFSPEKIRLVILCKLSAWQTIHMECQGISALGFEAGGKILIVPISYLEHWWTGSSCSKLTTSLVNDSLKFTSSDRQIC